MTNPHEHDVSDPTATGRSEGPTPPGAGEAGHAHHHGPGEGHDHGHGRGPVADASVRVARVSDAPAVGLVQAVVFREAYAGVLAPEVVAQFEPRAFAAAWRDSLEGTAAQDGVLLVACAGEQVVGFAAVGASDDPDAGDDTAELLVLGVHPDARHQGHGSRLLHAVVDTARARGRAMLTAWTLATAEDVRGFLTASGAEADGAHRERVVDADGRTVSEVRLSASVGPAEPAEPGAVEPGGAGGVQRDPAGEATDAAPPATSP